MSFIRYFNPYGTEIREKTVDDERGKGRVVLLRQNQDLRVGLKKKSK